MFIVFIIIAVVVLVVKRDYWIKRKLNEVLLISFKILSFNLHKFCSSGLRRKRKEDSNELGIELPLMTPSSPPIDDTQDNTELQSILPSCPGEDDLISDDEVDRGSVIEIQEINSRPASIETNSSSELPTVVVTAEVYSRRAVRSCVHSESDFEPIRIEQPAVEPSDTESEDNNSNESTETIPSIWEPIPVVVESSVSIDMIRSQSLEMLTVPDRPNSYYLLARTSSDPSVQSRRRLSSGGESYSHRHVRLSLYRSESQSLGILSFLNKSFNN